MLDMKNSLRDLIRPFASKFLVIKGTARGTESALSLVYSGPAEHLAYLQSRFFSDGKCAATAIGRRPLYMLRKMLAESGPSLGAVVLNRRLAKEIAGPEDLIVPLWIDCRVDLEGEREYARSKSLGADLRNIRKHELEWRISKSRKALDTFYERFYIPTVTTAHGRAAVLADKVERFQLFDAGAMELLQVKRRDKVIAAVTIDYRQSEPVLRDGGVLDGSAKLKKLGVIAALNLFSMDYLASKGYRRVGLGLSRSFLDDGVLAFKRKFRPTIRPACDQCLLLRTVALNSITRTILRLSPCFTWQGNELHRTYFQSAASPTSAANDGGNSSDWDFGIDKESIFDISGATLRLESSQRQLAKVS